jgi:hypothetical protein
MALDRTWYNSLVDDSGDGISGSVWDKADVDALMDAIDAEIARLDGRISMPYVYIRRNAFQSIPPSVFTPIAFDAEVSDAYGMWSPGSPTLITIPQDGCYSLHGVLTYELNATGSRFGMFRVNGTSQACPNLLVNANATFVTIVHHQTIAMLSAGQTLELCAFQTTSGNLQCSDNGGENATQFRIRKLA